MSNLIGRSMDMNGGSSASYLVRISHPLSLYIVQLGWKQKGFQTTRGGRRSFPLCGGTYPRSYSVSKAAMFRPCQSWGQFPFPFPFSRDFCAEKGGPGSCYRASVSLTGRGHWFPLQAPLVPLTGPSVPLAGSCFPL